MDVFQEISLLIFYVYSLLRPSEPLDLTSVFTKSVMDSVSPSQDRSTYYDVNKIMYLINTVLRKNTVMKRS